MVSITIKEIDEPLVAEIAKRAQRHRRSFDLEVRILLQEALSTKPATPDRGSRARAIAAMTPPDAVQTDSVALIREDRDR